MKYTNNLESQGYKIEIEKANTDEQGYDLYLKISKNHSFYESIFSMSHSLGYYFSYGRCDSIGEDNNWEFNDKKLISEYLEIDKLEEIQNE